MESMKSDYNKLITLSGFHCISVYNSDAVISPPHHHKVLLLVILIPKVRNPMAFYNFSLFYFYIIDGPQANQHDLIVLCYLITMFQLNRYCFMLKLKINSFISPSSPLQSSLILDPTLIRSPLATEAATAWSSLTYVGPQAMQDIIL